jgi:hypothetical protein
LTIEKPDRRFSFVNRKAANRSLRWHFYLLEAKKSSNSIYAGPPQNMVSGWIRGCFMQNAARRYDMAYLDLFEQE